MKIRDTELVWQTSGPAWAKSTFGESVTPAPIAPKMVDSGWVKNRVPDFHVGQEQAEVPCRAKLDLWNQSTMSCRQLIVHAIIGRVAYLSCL
jgi:hypothetical protein